jgi:hypothetical protein
VRQTDPRPPPNRWRPGAQAEARRLELTLQRGRSPCCLRTRRCIGQRHFGGRLSGSRSTALAVRFLAR